MGERGARLLQGSLNVRRERMRASKHTARGPFRPLERIHGQAEIGERGAGGRVKKNYASRVRIFGHTEQTLNAANNLSIVLVRAGNASESMAFSRPLLPLARRVLGADHHMTLRLAHDYAYAVLECAAPSRDELVFAEKLLEDTVRRLRRVLGPEHPVTQKAEDDMPKIRRRIANL